MKKLLSLIILTLVWSCAGPEGIRNGTSAPGEMASSHSSSNPASASATPCPSLTPRAVPEPRPVPAPIYGVTIEDIEDYHEDLTPILNSLKLSRMPTVRLIFNPWELDKEIVTYQKIARSIRRDNYVMGMILDSERVKNLDVSCYTYRTAKYVEGLGGDVDIWEVGNEVNGGWVRKHEKQWFDEEAAEVRDKIYGAYKIVKGAGGKTALTLYYNDDHKGNHCWKFKREEMFAWAREFIPPDMKDNLDYVLISFYEDDPDEDCKNEKSIDGEDQKFGKKRIKEWEGKPLDPDWVTVFSDLAVMFKKAKIGFGECGTNASDKKKEQITKYYQTIDEELRNQLPEQYRTRYVGGYFWWYFKQDMVPSTKELWGYFNNIIKSAPRPPDR